MIAEIRAALKTERQDAEAALKNPKGRAQSLVASANDSATYRTSAGRYLDWGLVPEHPAPPGFFWTKRFRNQNMRAEILLGRWFLATDPAWWT